MRLVSFSSEGDEGGPRVGVVVGEEVVDLADPLLELPRAMVDLLALGAESLARAVDRATRHARRVAADAVRLTAPVPAPPKVLGIGYNYEDHIRELGRDRPDVPVFFNKQRTCIVGPGDEIVVPRVSDQVDYEGELAMVIGSRCRDVTAAAAPRYVSGFTILNDVSVRDWQWRTPTLTMGKSFDTHGPMGPVLVSADELGDPHGLRIRTFVNGELRQDGTTASMIFDCWQQVEHLSTAFTLEPGDVIATGTPAGVGASFDPPRWLRPGDRVEVEVEGIGRLSNPVVAFADAAVR